MFTESKIPDMTWMINDKGAKRTPNKVAKHYKQMRPAAWWGPLDPRHVQRAQPIRATLDHVAISPRSDWMRGASRCAHVTHWHGRHVTYYRGCRQKVSIIMPLVMIYTEYISVFQRQCNLIYRVNYGGIYEGRLHCKFRVQLFILPCHSTEYYTKTRRQKRATGTRCY